MSEGDALTGRRRATVAEAMGRLPGPGGERFAEVLEHGSMEVEIYAPTRRRRIPATKCTWS